MAGLLLVARLGWVLIGRYRRSLLKGEQEAGGPWSLEDLRSMRDSGQLTEQEYRVLRERMIRRVGGSPGKAKGPTKSTGGSER